MAFCSSGSRVLWGHSPECSTAQFAQPGHPVSRWNRAPLPLLQQLLFTQNTHWGWQPGPTTGMAPQRWGSTPQVSFSCVPEVLRGGTAQEGLEEVNSSVQSLKAGTLGPVGKQRTVVVGTVFHSPLPHGQNKMKWAPLGGSKNKIPGEERG